MTVATTTNVKEYSGLLGQDTFAYDFRVDQKSDMNVYFNGILQPDGDWTITNLTNPAGGNVVLDTPLATDTVIRLVRTLPLTQAVDYQPFDAFPAETHEAALDKLTFIAQQLEERLESAVETIVTEHVVGVSSPSGNVTLLAAADTLAIAKNDRIVHVQGRITVGSVSSPVGSFILTALPYAPSALAETADTIKFPVLATGLVNDADGFAIGNMNTDGTIGITDISGATFADELQAFSALEFDFTYIAD